MAGKGHSAAPTRAGVEDRWRSLVEGQATRQEVHEWASVWVEHDDSDIADPMIRNGLQHLHGFDLTFDFGDPSKVRHGLGDRYVHAERDIARSLERWRANCAAYDADPKAFLARMRSRGLSKLDLEDE